MFSGSLGHKSELPRSQLSIQQMELILGKFGCDITPCSTGPDLVITDIVKPFILTSKTDVAEVMLQSVAMVIQVSAAATHGDHTDRTGIGGERAIAFTEDLSNYYPMIVSSSENVFH